MSKYDWSKVSNEISSIATDSNGRVLGYDVENPNLAKNKDEVEVNSHQVTIGF